MILTSSLSKADLIWLNSTSRRCKQEYDIEKLQVNDRRGSIPESFTNINIFNTRENHHMDSWEMELDLISYESVKQQMDKESHQIMAQNNKKDLKTR